MHSTRREKSLSLLCQKFLSFYPIKVNQNEKIVICLDQMAKLLDVERRRIYDIVNVLESVEILSRYCKNQYLWHGFEQIPFTLSKLKTLSIKSNFLEYTKALMLSQFNSSNDLHQDSKQALNVSSETYTYLNRPNKVIDTKEVSTQTINISREEKSLGIMSQKFLMLFLTSEDGLVSISFAARVLLGDTKNDITELGRYKTKIRRLYDIANVLTSIGLIKKYNFNDSSISRPAYKYIGPQVDVIRNAECVVDFMNLGNPSSNSKHSLFDHFKRNLNLECSIPKFDVNTGILHSERVTKVEMLENEQKENEMWLKVHKRERKPEEFETYQHQIEQRYYYASDEHVCEHHHVQSEQYYQAPQQYYLASHDYNFANNSGAYFYTNNNYMYESNNCSQNENGFCDGQLFNNYEYQSTTNNMLPITDSTGLPSFQTSFFD